ncbi:MAG: hypothetical protein AAF657_21045 [Acidobacteriota bacterium]
MGLETKPATAEERAEVTPRAGLCATCIDLQVLRSRRSTFVRCARADRDKRFARYPPLPVQACAGYVESS